MLVPHQAAGVDARMLERRGGFSPRKLSGMGSVKERGKGLRRTGVRRAAAAAPGPGRGGRVLAKGMRLVGPARDGALRSDDISRYVSLRRPRSGRADH